MSSEQKEKIVREFLRYLEEDTQYIESRLTIDNTIPHTEQSTLKSDTSFRSTNIPELLKNSLYNLGYDKLSNEQIESIPLIQSGKSVMYKSDSGTGKTISFVVGTLSQLISDTDQFITSGSENMGGKNNFGHTNDLGHTNDFTRRNDPSRTETVENTYPMIVVISPTIELNQQICSVYESVGKPANLTVRNIRRGERPNLIRQHVIIGSPHAIANTLRSLRLKNIKIIVIDEADVVLDPENMGTVTAQILRNVQFDQYLFFSATYSDQIRKLILRHCPNIVDKTDTLKSTPKSIKLYHIAIEDKPGLGPSDTSQSRIIPSGRTPSGINPSPTDPSGSSPGGINPSGPCHNETAPHLNQCDSSFPMDKKEILNNLFVLLNIGQCIIFVNTKKRAHHLSEYFRSDLHKVSVLHGNMDVTDRNNVSQEFRTGHTKILITTDVFSRGIDIPAVNLVINYDLPVLNNKPDYSTYIHRIGRCGRFGRKGFVIDFVGSQDDQFIFDSISREIGKRSDEIDLEALNRISAEIMMKGEIKSNLTDWTQD